MVALYVILTIYALIAVLAGFSAGSTLDMLIACDPEMSKHVTPFNRFAGCALYGLAWPFFLLGPLIQRAFGVR
ncbi:MAG TPA: hypothetical protein VLH56_18765 [Dissulfurispiraceae bacterium]|nr:hypothetical protein [Dissulfurispiraceae bacterium]